jgi:5-(carboxyamino)imidazole ribonucleotide synthase
MTQKITTVGILGGGQLARMLALAAYPLGIHTVCFEPTANTCASMVTEVINADYQDKTALEKFARSVDVITIETENIPLATAEFVASFTNFCPSLNALAIGQERGKEKNLFRELGIATPRFVLINSLEDLKHAVSEINLPAVLKTRRMGYDGKGQFVLRHHNELEFAWDSLGVQELILEEFIKFDRELSIIAVRSKNKEIKFYPLIENQHQEGILRLSLAPYEDHKLQKLAQDYAQKILDYFDYIGVLTIELFQVGNKLLVNEMAPRVHNSGHWTIEGADTSQFENHIRAICNLPLGSTAAHGYSAMVNCIGDMPNREKILSIAQTHYHSYEKSAAPKRKVGHITVTANNKEILQQQLRKTHENF